MNFDINEFANWFTERYNSKLSIADARFVEIIFGREKGIATKARHARKSLLLTAALEYYKEKRDGSG